MYVCLSVCLSVCLFARTSRKTDGRTLPIFCMLPMAVVQSSPDGVAIRYVLLVLRMMSCFTYHGASGPESGKDDVVQKSSSYILNG